MKSRILLNQALSTRHLTLPRGFENHGLIHSSSIINVRVPSQETDDDQRVTRRSRANRRHLTPREMYAPETIRKVGSMYTTK